MITKQTVENIKNIANKTMPLVLLPVLAQEEMGTNKIPLAMASVIENELNLDIEMGISQSKNVYRTNKGSDYRLVNNPTFVGAVNPLVKYIILDDTLTMGGSIASLKGYVESHGGKVVGAAVMTANSMSLDLPVNQKLLDNIYNKHGIMVNEYWEKEFGYGIDKLTQGEAGHVRSAKDIDEIRNRISQARNERSFSFDDGAVQKIERRD